MWLRSARHTRPLSGMWSHLRGGEGNSMKRKLFIIASGLSLLLCVIAVAGMIRSSWFSADWITLQSSDIRGDRFFCHVLRIESSEGGLSVRARAWNQTPHDAKEALLYRRTVSRDDGFHWSIRSGDFGTSMWGKFSYDWYNGVSGHEATRQLIVHCPEWLFAVAFLFFPVIAATLHIRRSRRTRAALCRSCGYDLRATPDRCPECGHVPESATT